MGWDITTIGQHHLKFESLESLAQQLSERLDINIDYGYTKKYVYSENDNTIKCNSKVEWVSQGLLKRHPDKIIYYLEDPGFCEREILSRCKAKGIHPIIADKVWPVGEDNPYFVLQPHGGEVGEIFYLDIYEDVFEVFLDNDPGRWPGFYHYFNDPEYLQYDMESLQDFRICLRWVAKAMGCEYVYLFSDQGPTDCIDIHGSLKWSEIEEYILSLRWIDDYYDYEVTRGRPDRRDYDKSVFNLIDIPAFLAAENPSWSKYYSDVFRDDFSDLNKAELNEAQL